MPKRDIALYIVDIFVAIDKIWRYTSRFSDAQEFLYSELSWDASIRELEIVVRRPNIYWLIIFYLKIIGELLTSEIKSTMPILELMKI